MSETKTSILIVDDSPDTLEVLERNLSSKGYRVHSSVAVLEAIDLLKTTPVDLVITDLKMPRISGIDLVRYVRENLPDTAVMMVTGFATIESAVEAIKTGAEEYLSKPFTDEELAAAVKRVLAKLKDRRAANGVEPTGGSFGIIGESAAIVKVISAIEKTAATSATVLITGESGVGKELVARAIHRAGSRSSAPFVPVNCGAIPEQLVESELFGHVRGAFTGATESREGFFQAADGGAVFLDEISELSPPTQVKLLRALQEGEILMVGSNQPRHVDVRILAATNKDLRALVEDGMFREDLFFRVSVINIEVPPLRERGDDILLLTNHLASKLAKAAGKPAPKFSNEALSALKNYSWPGNVRELENVLSHVLVMGEGGTIEVRDLPSLMRFRIDSGVRANRTLEEVELEYITKVLSSVDGNRTRAARILGIDRKTLRKKLGLPRKQD
jgi:DNA-binding NtrC family response regulator